MATSPITKSLRMETWRKSKGFCWYCGSRIYVNPAEYTDELGKTNPKTMFSVDHLIPLSKGGKTEIDNLVPCCFSCNATKHNRDFEEFRYYLAWQKKAGLLFTDKQKEYLKSIGLHLPEHEKNYTFWFEEQDNDQENKTLPESRWLHNIRKRDIRSHNAKMHTE